MADTTDWPNGMRDALKLVKAGELRGATRAIQAAIARRTHRAVASDPPVHAADATRAPLSLPAAASAFASERVADAAVAEPAVVFDAPPDVAPAPQDQSPFGHLTGMQRLPGARARMPHFLMSATAPLQYRLYAPADATEPRPLLVMLHGCSQNADDFARGTRAAEAANALGWYALFPEQTQRANGARCWNWFRPQDQIGDSGEPRALLDVIDTIAATHAIDATRVYVAGLSAGAAMAVILAARHPDRFAAVAAHSGLPFAAAHDVPRAFTAMRTRGHVALLPAGRFVPLLVLHGDADHTVAPANADALVAQWRAALPISVEHVVGAEQSAGRAARCERWTAPDGRVLIESWRIAGAAHAWSGGDPRGSYADEHGPDATAIMLHFFAAHATAA